MLPGSFSSHFSHSRITLLISLSHYCCSGEIKPTATRPAYTNVGTIDTSMTSAGSTAAATARSGAGRNEMRVGSGLVGMIVGAVVLAL